MIPDPEFKITYAKGHRCTSYTLWARKSPDSIWCLSATGTLTNEAFDVLAGKIQVAIPIERDDAVRYFPARWRDCG